MEYIRKLGNSLFYDSDEPGWVILKDSSVPKSLEIKDIEASGSLALNSDSGGEETVSRRKSSTVIPEEIVSDSGSSGYNSSSDFNTSDDPEESSVEVDREDSISSSESSYEGHYSLADLPFEGIGEITCLDDGIIRIDYKEGGTIYLASLTSVCGQFVLKNRKILREKGISKDGDITFIITTKSTTKGIMLEGLIRAEKKRIKENDELYASFSKTIGYSESIPSYFIDKEFNVDSDDSDDDGEFHDYDQKAKSKMYRVTIDQKRLREYQDEMEEEDEKLDLAQRDDISTSTLSNVSVIDDIEVGQRDVITEIGREREEFETSSHRVPGSSISIESFEYSQSSDQENENDYPTGDEIIRHHISNVEESYDIPPEEKEYIKRIKEEDRKEKTLLMLQALLHNSDRYVPLKEGEYLLYSYLTMYTGSVYPFMTQTMAYCDYIRKKRLYGTSCINHYRLFMEATMKRETKFVPREDVERLLQDKENFRKGKGKETSEESDSLGKYQSRYHKKSELDRVLINNDDQDLFRIKSSEEVFEQSDKEEKWKKLNERISKSTGDEVPLTILAFEALCAEWADRSHHCMSLMENYQNLTALVASIEKEVTITTEIDAKVRNGGVFISTNQFRAIRNSLAAIRSSKKNMIQSFFEGVLDYDTDEKPFHNT